MIIATIQIAIANSAEIQTGANTHHQDQVILSSSFNVIKTIVNNPTKPIPLDDDETLLLFILALA